MVNFYKVICNTYVGETLVESNISRAFIDESKAYVLEASFPWCALEEAIKPFAKWANISYVRRRDGYILFPFYAGGTDDTIWEQTEHADEKIRMNLTFIKQTISLAKAAQFAYEDNDENAYRFLESRGAIE